jgi:hypothetical protein
MAFRQHASEHVATRKPLRGAAGRWSGRTAFSTRLRLGKYSPQQPIRRRKAATGTADNLSTPVRRAGFFIYFQRLIRLSSVLNAA